MTDQLAMESASDELRQMCDQWKAACEDHVNLVDKKMVFRALNSGGTEALGTGHWYTCPCGYIFAVGDCGLPMETAPCPQCSREVGGAGHNPSAGVEHADAFERAVAQ